MFKMGNGKKGKKRVGKVMKLPQGSFSFAETLDAGVQSLRMRGGKFQYNFWVRVVQSLAGLSVGHGLGEFILARFGYRVAACKRRKSRGQHNRFY
jgi:hypothetical protein